MCVKLTCLFFAEYNTDMPIPLCERRLRGWHCNRGLSGVCVPSNKGARIVLNQDKLTTRRAKSARPPFGMLTVMDDRTFAPPPINCSLDTWSPPRNHDRVHLLPWLRLRLGTGGADVRDRDIPGAGVRWGAANAGVDKSVTYRQWHCIATNITRAW